MSLLLTVAPLLRMYSTKSAELLGSILRPPHQSCCLLARTVPDPKTVADLFEEHFASVSPKDPAAPGARYRQGMASLAVNCSSTGRESYNVPFSVSE
ncbi:hypothetical protein E2C01_081200 [Portunus trituberculatus]|uniref:Uncharacterized protein n=1 Tax=Portunus trituberculatus TaxID=210409 RepID=A0A5B7IV63_PORTR|nr:hypothetical protein [Portunus trituberculatus]